MTTLIDTILSTREKGMRLVEQNAAVGQDMMKKLGDKLLEIDQIILDGHGSSKTAALTAQPFMEKVTGIPVTVVYPNDMSRTLTPSPGALYIFISESGGSSLLKKDILAVGNTTTKLLVTASTAPALGSMVDHILYTGCEDENFFYHTVGHCCAGLLLMLTAMNIARIRGTLSEEDYMVYLEMAKSALNNQPQVVAQAREWCKAHADALNKARSIVLFGSGCLYGVVEEAAIKIQEITQNTLCKSFPVFQKLYGSTVCHDSRDVIFMLYDGINEPDLGLDVLDYANQAFGNGYLFGSTKRTERDFVFTPKGGEFRGLEYVAIFEVIAYEMTIALGKSVPDLDHMETDGFTKYMLAKNK